MNSEPDVGTQPGPDHPISLEAPASIAIIGAGPIGLEAALYGKFLGYNVTVLERGDVAANVADWKHVSMFTPFQMLHSPLARQAIQTQDADHVFPKDGELVTGEQWREKYLLPLAKSDLLRKCVRKNCRVVSIGRSRFRKHRSIGSLERLESAFTVVWQDPEGSHVSDEFDFVLDASGSYGNVAPWGPGGTPARGEIELRKQRETDETLASRLLLNVPEMNGPDWSGQRVLVLGDGFSAATTIQQLMQHDPTQLIWLSDQTVGIDGPLLPIEDDPLPARLALSEQVNHWGREYRRTVVDPEQKGIQFVSNSNLISLEWDARQEQFSARVRTWSPIDWENVEEGFVEPDDVDVEIEVDRVIVNVGYCPDVSISRELPWHSCYATEGPMALAQTLVGASGDCLAIAEGPCATVLTTEPRFFVLGIKSYGRLSQFLYQHGLHQVRDAYRWIVGRADLDLYARSI